MTNQSVTCLRTQFQNSCPYSLNASDGNLSTLFPQPNSVRPTAGIEGKAFRVCIITRKKHCSSFAAFYFILLVLTFSILSLCMLLSVGLQQKHSGAFLCFYECSFHYYFCLISLPKSYSLSRKSYTYMHRH